MSKVICLFFGILLEINKTQRIFYFISVNEKFNFIYRNSTSGSLLLTWYISAYKIRALYYLVFDH